MNMTSIILCAVLTVGVNLAGAAPSSAPELEKLVVQLRSEPENLKLRERIIDLALKAKPAVPDAVIDHEGRAEAAVQAAKSPEDYMDAAREYEKALLLAPWAAQYYYNLGLVLEKANRPADAARNFKLYLRAAPNARDRTAVRKKIAGLQYLSEKGAQVQAAKESGHSVSRLAGDWVDEACPSSVFSVKVMDGGRFEIRNTRYCSQRGGFEQICRSCTQFGYTDTLEAHGNFKDDGTIAGYMVFQNPIQSTIVETGTKCYYPGGAIEATGSHSAGKIAISAERRAYNSECGALGTGRTLVRPG